MMNNNHKTEIINNVPVMHWDFPYQECVHVKSAAKYTWECLEQISLIFCNLYCNRKICNVKQMESPNDISLLDFEIAWKRLQYDFHKCLAYLPKISNDNTCSACSITKALTCFPELMEYSPYPPILTKEIIPDVRFDDPQRFSIPCQIHFTLTEDDIIKNEWVREQALLYCDYDNLPAIKPWEGDKLVSCLKNGQLLVNALHDLKELGYIKGVKAKNMTSLEHDYYLHLPQLAEESLRDIDVHQKSIPPCSVDDKNVSCEIKEDSLSSIKDNYNLTEKQAWVLQYFIDQTKKGITTISEKKAFIFLHQKYEISSDRLRDTFKSRPKALEYLFKRIKPGVYSLKIPV